MSSDADAPIAWFRNTAPYINLHRGSTFVLLMPGDLLSSGALPRLLHDVALLSSLGVRLVLVHGSRPQIEARLDSAGLDSRIHRGRASPMRRRCRSCSR
jgi:amino-acid N-acetyltransferase